MFQLGKTIISEDVIDKNFVCSLSVCKGICCIDGEAGAPLEKEETKILEKIHPKIRPFLPQEAIAVIEKEGTWVTSEWGELETPLIDGKNCVYAIFDKKNIALCAIEQAYRSGEIDWEKPISCHLYPVRVKDYSEFSAVNYHKWEICKEACSLGKKLQMPIYKFVKQALIRKFGQDWYNELERVAQKRLKK